MLWYHRYHRHLFKTLDRMDPDLEISSNRRIRGESPWGLGRSPFLSSLHLCWIKKTLPEVKYSLWISLNTENLHASKQWLLQYLEKKKGILRKKTGLFLGHDPLVITRGKAGKWQMIFQMCVFLWWSQCPCLQRRYPVVPIWKSLMKLWCLWGLNVMGIGFPETNNWCVRAFHVSGCWMACWGLLGWSAIDSSPVDQQPETSPVV